MLHRGCNKNIENQRMTGFLPVNEEKKSILHTFVKTDRLWELHPILQICWKKTKW
jgi:hypothetical protein